MGIQTMFRATSKTSRAVGAIIIDLILGYTRILNGPCSEALVNDSDANCTGTDSARAGEGPSLAC